VPLTLSESYVTGATFVWTSPSVTEMFCAEASEHTTLASVRNIVATE
jgi:hypothetical protein